MSAIDHILDLAAWPARKIPHDALSLARLSLFDWMVCGRAGAAEPVARILRDLVGDEGGRPVASLFGGTAAPARAAALVNGATSHALDYDDTHFAHVGHPSVAIYPAALSVAEEVDATASDVTEAFLIGAEASVRIGLMLGRGHYNRGFHQTATAGTVGATVAGGRILALSREQMRAAIGLSSTRVSGLTSQFGTMGKPYNAGMAASNGVECAKLAAAGMTSADDGLEGLRGLVPTHSDSPSATSAWSVPVSERFLFEDIRYKLHACCHGLHAMIEALLATARNHSLSPSNIRTVRLRTNPRWLTVCDIKRPRTGLEVKFSYVWLAGMTLAGMPTETECIYSDTVAGDAGLAAFAGRVLVDGDSALTDTQAAGEIALIDGSILPFSHDLAGPQSADALASRLVAKANGLIGDEAQRLWQAVTVMETLDARDIGTCIRAA